MMLAAQAEQYLPMIRRVRRRTFPGVWQGCDVEEMESEGVIGLVKGLQSYDASRGPIEPYLWRRIQGAMLDWARREDRLSRGQRRLQRTREETMERLRAELGREPDDGEVAAALGLDLAEYQATHDAWQNHAHITTVRGEDGDEVGILDLLANDDPDPEAHLERKQVLERLRLHIEELPERDRAIIRMYFLEDVTMAEIAAVLGVSVPRVSQLVKRILGNLRERLINEGITC
ncbi:MAG: sigma-70 family RNA polymerase sigma factor [Candidatus Dadabacteria bacterium]|nr:MAG: sigma-70 family RNA polymerase sigma factor [Candidatus Dadabacteria bacterium]